MLLSRYPVTLDNNDRYWRMVSTEINSNPLLSEEIKKRPSRLLLKWKIQKVFQLKSLTIRVVLSRILTVSMHFQ